MSQNNQPLLFINLHFNWSGQASTSVLPFHTTEALSEDGRDYWPKHVAVNVTNNGYTLHYKPEGH